MRIGILTGGGDAPGLNGIIESASRSLLKSGHEVIGIQDAFEGIFEQNFRSINLESIDGLHAKSGTFLGTSNKCSTKGREVEFLENYKKINLDGLIVAGGDGTFSALSKFKDDIPLIGVPKTIDNDLAGTEVTFGFDTACSVVADAVESLQATADAHRRIIVVETMGRTAGWIALGGGLVGYADGILIPERPFSEQKLIEFVNQKKKSGRRGLIFVVSEGAFAEGSSAKVAFTVKGSPQAERFGGIGQSLAKWFEVQCDWESRQVVLGHLQRAKPPTTTDRFLTLSMGLAVARLADKKQWGKAVVYKEGRVTSVPLKNLMEEVRLVSRDHRWVKMAESLGIFI